MLRRGTSSHSGADIAEAADSASVLAAENDEAFVSESGGPVVTRISPQQLASLTAWADRLVLLEGMTLAEAVRELNRYNRVQLVLGDAEAGTLRLGGAVELRKPLAFVASLQELGCQVGSGKGEVILISKCALVARDARAAR